MGCCLLATAAKGALSGAIWGAVSGTAGGALNSAIDYYMEENGTLDGSGRQILEGASTGFAVGALEGAKDGFIDGATKYLKNPSGYCFIAGTLVLTIVGLASIEDIRPGDYVYAEDTETGEQAYMPVLETFSHEVSETYTVTIEGESIETTSGHPFYVVEEGWVGADELEAGDEVELADGGSGTVDSVEKNELDEPVTVYNFAVMDYHTYYVGENGALVHNKCNADVDTPNAGGPGGQALPESGIPSGYYQDSNGRWHRPNGQFASNAEVGITSPVKTTTGSHGNSLSDPRTNYGYALVDKDTNDMDI